MMFKSAVKHLSRQFIIAHHSLVTFSVTHLSQLVGKLKSRALCFTCLYYGRNKLGMLIERRLCPHWSTNRFTAWGRRRRQYILDATTTPPTLIKGRAQYALQRRVPLIRPIPQSRRRQERDLLLQTSDANRCSSVIVT